MQALGKYSHSTNYLSDLEGANSFTDEFINQLKLRGHSLNSLSNFKYSYKNLKKMISREAYFPYKKWGELFALLILNGFKDENPLIKIEKITYLIHLSYRNNKYQIGIDLFTELNKLFNTHFHECTPSLIKKIILLAIDFNQFELLSFLLEKNLLSPDYLILDSMPILLWAILQNRMHLGAKSLVSQLISRGASTHLYDKSGNSILNLKNVNEALIKRICQKKFEKDYLQRLNLKNVEEK